MCVSVFVRGETRICESCMILPVDLLPSGLVTHQAMHKKGLTATNPQMFIIIQKGKKIPMLLRFRGVGGGLTKQIFFLFFPCENVGIFLNLIL